jgi:hypothetical protein
MSTRYPARIFCKRLPMRPAHPAPLIRMFKPSLKRIMMSAVTTIAEPTND